MQRTLIAIIIFFSVVAYHLPAEAAFTQIAVTPALAKAGTTVQVTFRTTVPLQADPQVTCDGLLMSFISFGGGMYTYRYVVQSTDDDGWKDLEITATDTGGNPVSARQVNAVRFDLAAPLVVNLTTTPALAKVGTTVQATFKTTESVQADPQVTCGGLSMSFISLIGGVYTYQYVVQGTEGDGWKDVNVTVYDLAGNPGDWQQVHAVRFALAAPGYVILHKDGAIYDSATGWVTTCPPFYPGVAYASSLELVGDGYMILHKDGAIYDSVTGWITTTPPYYPGTGYAVDLKVR